MLACLVCIGSIVFGDLPTSSVRSAGLLGFAGCQNFRFPVELHDRDDDVGLGA